MLYRYCGHWLNTKKYIFICTS